MKIPLIRRRDFYLIPNVMTLSRVVAVPLVAGFAYYKYDLAAAAFFGLAGVSDYLDGFIARRYHYESKLGMLLDPLADKLIVVSTMIMLLWLGRLKLEANSEFYHVLPPILVIVTVGREMAITGLRAIASTVDISMPADRYGKLKTWIQFWAIVCLLINRPIFSMVGLFLLTASVLAALLSGIQYTWRFLKELPD